MKLPRGLRAALTVTTVVVLVVIYVPLLLVLLNSFNTSRTFAWPPPDLTLKWWRVVLAQIDRGVLLEKKFLR